MGMKSKFDYFDAFVRQSEVACKEADLLMEVVENFTTAEDVQGYMPRAHELEHQGDVITHDIYTAIAVDFVTPIEREDLMTMSQTLDDVIDKIEDVIQMFYMFDIHFMHHGAIGLAECIQKSTTVLAEAMKGFRDFKKSTSYRDAIIQINTYEEEADQMYIDLIRSLHTIDRDNAMRVLVWTQIFQLMENVTDACEHVADAMSSILLKNA